MTERRFYTSNSERPVGSSAAVANRLAGKVATVIGAAHGFGKATAIRLGQEGAKVFAADKDLKLARETASELQSLGAEACAFQVDVTNRKDVDAMLDAVLREFHGVDILVNNLEAPPLSSFLECGIRDWDRAIAADLTSPFYYSQAAARQMVRQGPGGRLIHLGSTASLLPVQKLAARSVAEAGLLMLSRLAALALVEHEITSNLVCLHCDMKDLSAEQIAASNPIPGSKTGVSANRLARFEEVAAVAAFLASDEAAYITGVEIVQDGGASISSLWWR